MRKRKIEVYDSLIVNGKQIQVHNKSIKFSPFLELKETEPYTYGGKIYNFPVGKEASKGSIKFTIYNDTESEDLVESWSISNEGNEVQLQKSESGAFITFNDAVLSEQPEFNSGEHGVEISFECGEGNRG